MENSLKSIASPKVKDLMGLRFGKLVVVGFAGILKYTWGSRSLWRYRCDCGVIKIGRSSDIQRATSCGCVRKDALRKLFTTHGETQGRKQGKKPTPEYRTWSGIISRCENPKVKAYKDYGGRGISVCPRWRRSFGAFLSDMGRRPSPRHSIERQDNDKGYSPENCVWMLRNKQVRNRRISWWLIYNGQRMFLVDWAKETQVPYGTLWMRLRAGWSVERTLSTPRHG